MILGFEHIMKALFGEQVKKITVSSYELNLNLKCILFSEHTRQQWEASPSADNRRYSRNTIGQDSQHHFLHPGLDQISAVRGLSQSKDIIW